MKVNITARHTDLTVALSDYVEKRLKQINKYSHKITSASVILNVEKDRHIAEITLGAAKNNINGKATAGDMYAAIDLVMDKIVKQLKKRMERMKEHKDIPPYAMVANIINGKPSGSENVASGEPEIQEIKEFKIEESTIDNVLGILGDRNLSFWVFREPGKDYINIVYRKEDGSFGMMILR